VKTITGKEFKLMVLGSGLNMRQVYKKAGVSVSSATDFVNKERDITKSNYDKLVDAFNELKDK